MWIMLYRIDFLVKASEKVQRINKRQLKKKRMAVERHRAEMENKARQAKC